MLIGISYVNKDNYSCIVNVNNLVMINLRLNLLLNESKHCLLVILSIKLNTKILIFHKLIKQKFDCNFSEVIFKYLLE